MEKEYILNAIRSFRENTPCFISCNDCGKEMYEHVENEEACLWCKCGNIVHEIPEVVFEYYNSLESHCDHPIVFAVTYGRLVPGQTAHVGEHKIRCKTCFNTVFDSNTNGDIGLYAYMTNQTHIKVLDDATALGLCLMFNIQAQCSM